MKIGGLGVDPRLQFVSGLAFLSMANDLWKGRSPSNMDLRPTHKLISNVKSLKRSMQSHGGDAGHSIHFNKFSKKKKDSFRAKSIRDAVQNIALSNDTNFAFCNIGNQDISQLAIALDRGFFQTTSFFGIGGIPGSRQRRLWLDNLSQDLVLVNVVSTPIEVCLYWCMFTDSTSSNLQGLARQGLADKFSAPSVYQVYGTNPQMSIPLKKYTKVLYSKHFGMSPGQVEKFSMYREIERFLDSSGWESTDASLAGITTGFLIHLKGIPIKGTDAGQTPSMGFSKVQWACTSKLRYRWVAGALDPATNTTTNFSNVPGGGQFMNQDTGDVDTVQTL